MLGFTPEGLVDPTENTVFAERFRLIRPLGQGGMGAAWLAHHITLRRKRSRSSPGSRGGLTRAHAADLIHRDLEPANLFLVHDDDREIVTVSAAALAAAATAAAAVT